MHDTREFSRLMSTSSPALDRAMGLIASTGRPELDPDDVLVALDRLAELTPASNSRELFRALFGSAEFGSAGFRGNTTDYHDPRNSLLDQVLERRLGIPISLAVVAIEVGRRRGVDLVGVGMPGHFLVRDALDDRCFFDPFSGDEVLDRSDCRRLFTRLHGDELQFRHSFLDPTPTFMIVVRVLNNLYGGYARLQDRAGLARILGLQTVLPGSAVGVRRQLAGVLAADGQFLEAARAHEQLVSLDPEHAHEHTRSAMRLRAQLN